MHRSKIEIAYDRFRIALLEDDYLQSMDYQIVKTYWLGHNFHIVFNQVPNCVLRDLIQVCFYGTYNVMRFNSSVLILE